jgi:hypothetical protein
MLLYIGAVMDAAATLTFTTARPIIGSTFP